LELSPQQIRPYLEEQNSLYFLNSPHLFCLKVLQLLYSETKEQLNHCLVNHQNPQGLCLEMLPQLVAFLEQVLQPVCSKIQLYLARQKTKNSQTKKKKNKEQSLHQLTLTLTKSSSSQLLVKQFRKTLTLSRLKRK